MPRHDDQEPDLTVAEAAELKAVTQRTIWRWIDDGTLPAYRVGRRLVRIRPADLRALDSRIPAKGA